LAFGVFLAVEAELGIVGKIGTEVEKKGAEIFILSEEFIA
jgi:hypothetical protein